MLLVSNGAVTVPSYTLLLTVIPNIVIPVTPRGLDVMFAVVLDWSVIE